MELIPQHYFVYDGKPSSDFGVWISGGGTFNAPARDVTMISVPGRNGDLTFDNGRYNNINLQYPAFISRNFQGRIEDFRAWICSKRGYVRLEDSYHPEEYRLAIYKSGLTVSPVANNIAGRFTLTFECKPQRFLKAGEISQKISTSGKVFYNPTLYDALPLIKCVGTSGTITLGGVTVTASGLTASVTLDCDLSEAYEGSTNRNNNISVSGSAFPKLAPGPSTVTFTGFSSVEITPRWWKL